MALHRPQDLETTTPALGEAAFRLALEGSADVVLLLDPAGRVRFVNRSGLALFGVADASRLEGLPWTSFAPQAARDLIDGALAEAASGVPASCDMELAAHDRSQTWWNVKVAPTRDDAGRLTGLVAVMRDVTDIKLASQAAVARLPAVTATAAVLRAALRLAQLDAWRYDYDRQTVAFTPELRDTLGKSAEEQPLSEALKIWVESDRLAFKRRLNEAVRTRSDLVFEGRIVTEAGESRWLRVLGEPEIVNGRCVALRGASQDITEERAALARLRASEETARKAADAMSGFLATMSHEIRTPLNGVLGMAQAMAMGDLPAEQRQHLKVIQTSGESLLALLNDLLDLSKIEAGKIELEDGLIDPQALADGARVFESLLAAKGVRLRVSVAPRARGLWAGDVTRVRQLLSNLVSNAVKFTERGEVAVTLTTRKGEFVMRVRDTGIGIAADKLGDVFDKFIQADSSTTRRFGGTGLGLAICQELARMMGGEITVDSALGEGSTFTARLPLRHVEAGARRAEAPQDAPLPAAAGDQALRILAAEDNPTNQLVLTTLLGAAGVDPVVVGNGQEALDAWRAADWDVVLMDVHMPVVDGVRAVVEMRAEELRRGRRRTPVIALTANAMTHQRDEYLAAGMDALVAKPIELAELLRTMEAVLADAAAAETSVATPAT